MSFLITGAAGFLGSYLTFRLLGEGARVVALVRPRGGESGEQRLARLRDDFAHRGAWPPAGLTVLEGDIREPALGLGAREASRLGRRLGQIVHCAARVDFAADRRARVMAANRDALPNFEPLLSRRGPIFNLMSTAYVCGETPGPVPERRAPDAPRFRNAYEESKHGAERFVAEQLAARGLPWRILRPSIVVGERRSGRTRGFHALYAFLELLDRLYDRARGNGDGDGLALRIRCRERSGLDLVPVDWVTAAAASLLRTPSSIGGVFHLTSAAPMTLERLGELLSAAYPGLTLSAARSADFAARPPDARERMLDRGLAPYRPYLDCHPRFESNATRRLLDEAVGTAPPLDGDWLRRTIGYCRSVGWGRQEDAAAEDSPELAYCRGLFDRHLPSLDGLQLTSASSDVDVSFEVRLSDAPAFRRRIEVRAGRIAHVGRNGSDGHPATWSYEVPSAVLRRIATAQLDPREAFFSRQAEIRGDIEAGLGFANLVVELFRRSPFEEAGESD